MAVFLNDFPEDRELVEGLYNRNEESLKKVDERYRHLLYAAARGILSSHEDIEECIQDTLLDAWNSIPPNKPDRLLGYLIRILKNNAISAIRKEKAKKRIPRENLTPLYALDNLTDRKGVEEIFEEKELHWILDQYITKLDEERRYILIGHFLFDKPVRKVANELNVSKHRVEKEIHIIREEIRSLLKERGFEI